mmetsp:Transcript_86094/g.271470  ORF Transcript_86094/g.271470 Transcript_86094/m.271470 type:complete len:202 (-) Transcript_86094:610-1215(-)
MSTPSAMCSLSTDARDGAPWEPWPSGQVTQSGVQDGAIQSRPRCSQRRRLVAHRRLSLMNMTPQSPPKSPRRQKATISEAIHSFRGLNVDRDSVNKVSRFAPPRFRYLSVKLAEKAAMKAKSNVWRPSGRTEPNSSTAKSTPPRGAPKAPATPAAAPAAMKSRSSMTAFHWRGPKRAPKREASAPNTAPLWIIGPSLPQGR